MVRRILTFSCVLALLGACSSSADDTAPAPASTTVGRPTTAPPATLAGPVEPVAADDPYCTALGAVEQLDAVQELAGSDPAEIAAAVDVATAAVEQLALVAPEEVRADWATIASVYDELFGAYRDAGFDLAALMSDPASAGLLERLGGREVLDAGDRVEQHAEAACGMALGLGRTVTTDEPPAEPGPEPELAAAATTEVDPSLSDSDAASIGRLLLEEFGVTATDEEAACFGRAISDPVVVAAVDDGSALLRFRALAARCGIDTTR